MERILKFKIMKNLKTIAATLLMAMVVSFSSNTQAQEQLPYNMYAHSSLTTQGWTDSGIPDFTSHASVPVWGFYRGLDGTVIYEKSFNLSGMSALDITYAIDYQYIGMPVDIEFEVYIDGQSVITETVNVDINSTVQISDNGNGNFTPNSTVKIVFDYTGVTSGSLGESIVFRLDEFSITGTPYPVGVNEHNTTNNLEVYSSNKTVFISTTENMNANVTVFNLSGQVVTSSAMELSNSKTELNLNNVSAGMYIVTVNDGTVSTSKKVSIK